MKEVNLEDQMRRHQGSDTNPEVTTEEIQPLSIESPITVQMAARRKRSRRNVYSLTLIGMGALLLIGISVWFIKYYGNSDDDISPRYTDFLNNL